MKGKSDACILPTTIGRLPEFTRQISYIFIDDTEEPPRERTPATVKECWRYHVVDRSEKGSEDVGYWIFEARKASSRSSKLAGVLLLRKVPQLVSADHIETIMKSVPRKATIVEGPSWRCRYWIWNACEYGFN